MESSPVLDIATKVIREYCVEFVEQSKGLPIFKSLPKTYNAFDRVKVRQKGNRSDVTDTFNEAFIDIRPKLYQSCVFVNARNSFIDRTDQNQESYYVFPIDNFRFLYCEQVNDSDEQFQQSFTELLELLEKDHDKTKRFIKDLMKQTYEDDDLTKAIITGSEILLFNIPHFYVLKTSHVVDYDELVETILQ